MRYPLAALVILLAGGSAVAAEDGFVPLFNGRDLSGWVNVNCAPETWAVSEGMIHCSGTPTGALRTEREYEDFILELEWRHLTSGGNSGVFIWGTPIAAPGVPFLQAIEVQVLDHGYNTPGKNEWYTTHGDVFPIHGSTMEPFGRHNGMRSFPSEERSKGTPEWNEYRIVCSNGVIRLQVNGREVSGGKNCTYRKGYIGLESEGAPIDFRNLRIKELPSSGASEQLCAPLDQHWRSLFTGLDLRGWRTNSATAPRWRVEREHLALQPGSPGREQVLWAVDEFRDAEIIMDCRISESVTAESSSAPRLLLGHSGGEYLEIKLEAGKPGTFERYFITVKGNDVMLSSGTRPARHLATRRESPVSWSLGLGNGGAGAEFLNLYARDL